MEQEQEYIGMIYDTSKLVSKEKAVYLSDVSVAFNQSAMLSNDVEFWKWMAANYPRNLADSELIQQAARNNAGWLNTQLQGKGYEWDYMTTQRMKPSKIMSVFEAGDCPTQPGIDITEKGLIDNSIKATYQNKAYLSNNNPDLHNTPKDAIVVTNKEKVFYAEKQGYTTEGYMNSTEIKSVKNSRFKKAVSGRANTVYTLENIIDTLARAGIMGAAIAMTVETLGAYKSWKYGELTDEQYLSEIMKAGGNAGITTSLTSAAMVPVQATITAAGASTLIAIPVAFIFGTAINSVIASCFGRGKYKQILEEVKYYCKMEEVFDDFLNIIEKSANQYISYVNCMQFQLEEYKKIQYIDEEFNKGLKKLYESI